MSEYQGTFKRYEKKYLVTQQQYNALAKAFAARMVPDRFAESTISNIYYDTPDFRAHPPLARPSGVQGEAAPAYLPHAGCRYRGVCGDQEKIRPHRLQAPHCDDLQRSAGVFRRRRGTRAEPDFPRDRLVSALLQGHSACHVHLLRPARAVRQVSAGAARHVRLGHSVAHGRFRPVLRLGRRAAAAARHLPDGDQRSPAPRPCGWRGR